MRIAVFGCGSIGRRHLRNLRALGHDDLCAFDPDPRAARSARDESGADCSGNVEDLWALRPDVALIASPSDLHVQLAQEAADRGCHLFIEKPVSHNLDGLERLEGTVRARGLKTMVGCNMRFHPGPATVKQLLHERAIGEPIAARIETGSFLPRWHPWQDYRESYSASPESGGAILDCIHEIDLALWYFGPGRVLAAAHVPARAIELTTDGLAEMLLAHDSGTLTSVHLNFVQRDYHRRCHVIGSAGTLYWDINKRRVDTYDGDGTLARSYEEPAGWDTNTMYMDELAHFLEAVRSGVDTMNPLAGGISALRVALDARHAGGADR